MNVLIIGIGIFVVSIIVIELAAYGYKNMRVPKRAKIRKKLRAYSSMSQVQDDTDILRREVLSNNPFVNTILNYIPGSKKINKIIIQANAPYQVGSVISFTLSAGIIGVAAGLLFFRTYLTAGALSLILGSIPFIHLQILKRRRIEKFKRQFPEALELIARSLRAGHAFTSGVSIAADEFDDPLGPEFSETLDEINFGISVSDALRNLRNRVDCPEVRQFTVAVNLQRETGGNLSEILESLSYLIREKFKFKGKVNVLSAEGKLSAVILSLMPIVIGVYLRITNPNYLDNLFYEPVGRLMLGGAVVMMVVGGIVMKRIVSIKV